MAGSNMIYRLLFSFFLVGGSFSCLYDSDCPNGFCEFESGKCGGFGTCASTPHVCYMLYHPVCGCDGKTYPNDCHAKAHNISISAHSSCEEKVLCSTNEDCASQDGIARYCKLHKCQGTGECATTPDVCMMFISAVCGCDGKTYSNACQAEMHNASISHDGACLRI